MSFDEVSNFFDIGSARGLSGASVEKIPTITITNDNNVDSSGDRVCSVCLQVCYCLWCIFHFKFMWFCIH